MHMNSKRLAWIVAVLGTLLALVGPAAAFENTIRVIVEPSRQWQCGDGFFPNGGSRAYEMVRILAGTQVLGSYDMAEPADCRKMLEYTVDLPDGGTAITTVEVGDFRMDAPVTGRDRNRIWTVRFFVDAAWAELTEDHVEARVASSVTPVDGTYRNTIELQVAPGRLWQCGDGFFANGGSETYRYGRLLVDDEEVARVDFAAQDDCTRILRVTRDLTDGGKAHVTLQVGSFDPMGADLTSRDWERTWKVLFFVDQIWGEVAEGSR
jgi:hypothetical protein